MMKIRPRSPEPFLYEGGETGILLIHGFTGSTAEMQPMGRYFQRAGYTVHAPLLAGHGTTPEDMATTRWPDWWNSALAGFQALKRRGCRAIIPAGLSMGGLLALRLAIHQPATAVISMNAPIEVRDKRIRWAKYVRFVKPYILRTEKKADHIEAGMFPYDRSPLVCTASLWDLIKTVKRELDHVTAPALIIQSEQDETIEPDSSGYIYSTIRSNYKEIKLYGKSGHIITLDREREQVFQDIANFMEGLPGNDAAV
ncbi:alpha/beta fold hydrolase [Aneurinibacillus sp. Ricciae_BoGa-3]|uniref:alpha/beta hydrolase n=1 Tax=Aneurinibacillus sp. Ricciae_BoGa-3 TaxID=3022697 RepID=UPI0023413F5D|nr:alpha/beta fold hydrolase [Aneurinibacillus sp. Ricciae_BoGa-3]WCK54112.1 alpha/beta fold hydrolase [Aneurinibacillus sp. Ricciae_BoGa-3]